MQQHPIPQNITGFEFKLIGDMTIKQFAYLAGGFGMGYLTFISPLYPLIKFPLVLFMPILGIALAFLPIEGRPLDRWISNFIKALFAPSQYMFRKESTMPEFLKIYAPPSVVPALVNEAPPTSRSGYLLPAKGDKEGPKQPAGPARPIKRDETFTTFLQTIAPSSPLLDKEEQEKLAKIATLMQEEKVTPQVPHSVQTNPSLQTQIVPRLPQNPEQAKINAAIAASLVSGLTPPYQPPPPSPPVTYPISPRMDAAIEQRPKEEKRLSEENQKLKAQLVALQKKIAVPQLATAQNQLMQEALDIEKSLQEALSEKERLSSELTQLKSRLAPQTHTQPVTPMPPPKILQSEKVRIVPPHLSTQAGLAGLPQVPNIISGIIKDAKGEVLPNIIVEVKDATDTPVRAFKTNKLGQFSGATPLPNGRYTIELEDPKNTYSFDVIAIELKGEPYQPLEIIAKDQDGPKQPSEREQLYKSLFGKQQVTS